MIKIQQLLQLTITTTVILSPSISFALEPDSRGDYYSWASNWVVVDNSRLNCRSGPDAAYRILTKYPRGSSLPTLSELEGDPIRRDRQGRPWVRIKWAGTSGTPCYVRANTSFIRPLDDFTIDEAACVIEGIKKGRSYYDSAFGCGD